MQRRKLEELNLMDDFLFNAMLTHPETGEKFIYKILKLLFDREFKNLKPSAQKVYAGMNTDLRGARLDVCIEGDYIDIEGSEIPAVYDVEPDQNNKAKDVAAFPKRSRFYHAIIDSRSLKTGEDFGKLKQVYVIFICNYDPFGYDRVLYTIKNRCLEEPEMEYLILKQSYCLVLFREVFWHEYDKIPRHTGQNAITEGDLECILTKLL